jgi:hypothetical protein
VCLRISKKDQELSTTNQPLTNVPPPVLEPHEAVARLTQQHIEEARDHNAIAQARAAMPKMEEDASSPFEVTTGIEKTPLGKAYADASDWLNTHEKHLSEKYLAPFRQGLDNMASDLQQAGETGHTASGGQLSPLSRALVEGAGSMLRFVPVGKNVKETAAALAPMPGGLGKLDFSSIPSHTAIASAETQGLRSAIEKPDFTSIESHIEHTGGLKTGTGVDNPASPLRTMVTDADAEARVGRRLNRKPGIGEPKNDALVLKDKDGKTYVYGNASTSQIQKRWNSHLDDETIQQWREWYPNIGKQFRESFGEGEEGAKKMMAWLGSQQNTSPSGGMMNVLRAEDLLSGQPKIKSAGIAENNIFSMLKGEVPEGGYGAKLHDFVDSALGKKTRTVMGDDVRGGAPAVVDVHGARGMGFTDQTLVDHVESKFGKDASAKLKADMSGAPSEQQYEFGSKKLNKIAADLNKKNFMGGGWTAHQVQAVDWASMIKQFGREPELPNTIFDKNVRTISYEVGFGKDSPYAKQFPALSSLPYEKAAAITRDVSDHVVKIANEEAGGHVVSNLFGPGGWQTNPPAPSGQLGHLASPEAAERAANAIGFLLQQDAVLTSRPLQSGTSHFFQIAAPSKELSDPSKVQKFFTDLREQFPRVDGFMPVNTPTGGTGIKILKINGHFSEKDIAALKKAAEIAGDKSKMERLEITHGPAEVRVAENDWRKNPDGKNYRQRIGQIGRPDFQRRMELQHAPSTEEAIRNAFRKHAPEALGPNGETVYYHGAPAEAVEEIRSNGLKSDEIDMRTGEGRVYFTPDREQAIRSGQAKSPSGRAAVVHVEPSAASEWGYQGMERRSTGPVPTSKIRHIEEVASGTPEALGGQGEK